MIFPITDIQIPEIWKNFKSSFTVHIYYHLHFIHKPSNIYVYYTSRMDIMPYRISTMHVGQCLNRCFFICTHIFPPTANIAQVTTLPDIIYAVTSHPFSKWVMIYTLFQLNNEHKLKAYSLISYRG